MNEKIPRGVIEVNGLRADFDLSRPGPDLPDRWQSDDPLLLSVIRDIGRDCTSSKQDVNVAAVLHILKLARHIGARVVELIDCPPVPDDVPESWWARGRTARPGVDF